MHNKRRVTASIYEVHTLVILVSQTHYFVMILDMFIKNITLYLCLLDNQSKECFLLLYNYSFSCHFHVIICAFPTYIWLHAHPYYRNSWTILKWIVGHLPSILMPIIWFYFWSLHKLYACVHYPIRHTHMFKLIPKRRHWSRTGWRDMCKGHRNAAFSTVKRDLTRPICFCAASTRTQAQIKIGTCHKPHLKPHLREEKIV